MKVKSQFKTVILAAALVALSAHSQIITNYVSPTPTWRDINGQIYDAISLPSVEVPSEFTYLAIGYSGVPKQPILLQGFVQGNPSQSVTFVNFPYDPGDFSPVHGLTGLQPSHPLYCRALKTVESTNWNVLGQPISVDTVYDCGTSVTKAILVIPAQ